MKVIEDNYHSSKRMKWSVTILTSDGGKSPPGLSFVIKHPLSLRTLKKELRLMKKLDRKFKFVLIQMKIHVQKL